MAPVDIHSQESRDLLDIIDKLRSQGLGGYVDLPQIIVCGDQSSGKSSVLEAISGLSFPSKDNLCTRFATELILRRDKEAKVDVSIIPHQSRTEAEKAKLKSFTAELDPENADIGSVIENAKTAMGIDDDALAPNGKRFSDDVLRIQLSGPKQQLLTLVDLPGLFLAGNSKQSTHEAPVVKKLILDYMRNNRSIILATVSAATDFATQGVTSYSRKFDPHGLRTMGLITKPDKLDAGSDSESSYVKLVSNQDVVLKLGWHVLKNRGFGQESFTSAERDASETEFFANPERTAWMAVDQACLGVGNLRSRLSDVLHKQIVQQLPSMLAELETKLQACNAELEKLGTSRQTVPEQKQYLTRVSSKFSSLMQAAVDGNYADLGFFGTAKALEKNDSKSSDSDTKSREEEERSRRLRAVVQNHLVAFSHVLAQRGHTWQIIDDDGSDNDDNGDSSNSGNRGNREPSGSTRGITYVLRKVYINKVRAIISRSRGRELPGLFNPLVVGDLFRDQSKMWKKITDKWASEVVNASAAAIKSALEACADPDTANTIFAAHITPALEELTSAMDVKLLELYSAQTDTHPITYNHYLTENVQKARQDRMRKKLKPLFKEVDDNGNSHMSSTAVKACINKVLDTIREPDMEKVAASDAIDYMEAYYKVALKRYSDDFGLLVVEQCLMSKLSGLFTPEMVCMLSDEEVTRLAGESDASIAKRKHLEAKIELFRKGIEDLGRFERV